MPKFAVILAAAGKSSRFNDPNYKKPFALLNQKPIWLYSAELFQKRNDVAQLILVISPEDEDDFKSRFGANLAIMGIDLVFGGAERSDSVQNALNQVNGDIDYVAIHDAARPCIYEEFVDTLFSAVQKHDAVVPAVPVASTLKRSLDGSKIEETVDRTNLYQAQTPQVFSRELICESYQQRGTRQPTDEAQLIEWLGKETTMVKGSPLNIKITTQDDLRLAQACLKSLPKPQFDAPLHPFSDDPLRR